MIQATASCFELFMQAMPVAFCFAFANAGRSMLARMATMAITTRSSINVKADGGVAFAGYCEPPLIGFSLILLKRDLIIRLIILPKPRPGGPGFAPSVRGSCIHARFGSESL